MGFVFAYKRNDAFTYRNCSKEINCDKRKCSTSSTLSGYSKITGSYGILKAHNSIKPGREIGKSLTKRCFLTPRQTREATVS
jgi:hypothetical protein